MPSATQIIGAEAESVATRFLRAQGFTILLRNWRRRAGELDVVARKGALLVIAEVRMRADDHFGGAAASVGLSKQRRIARAAQQLLQQRPELRTLSVRFDVLVVAPGGGSRRVEWIRHAFEAR